MGFDLCAILLITLHKYKATLQRTLNKQSLLLIRIFRLYYYTHSNHDYAHV